MMYESVIIQNGAGRDACFFPYQPQPAEPFPAAVDVRTGMPSLTSNGRMLRVAMNWSTVDWRFRNTAVPLNVGLANSMCQSPNDDLLLTAPGQEPLEGQFGITVSQTDLPASQHDTSMQNWDTMPAANGIKRNFDGRMSWFATMVPLPGSVSGGSRYYTLSVAVVERRTNGRQHRFERRRLIRPRNRSRMSNPNALQA